MPLTYINAGTSGPFAQYTLSNLTSAILEPVDPSPGFSRAFMLTNLLILSNHNALAHELICALCKYSTSIPSNLYGNSPFFNSPTIEYFWQTHPSLARPLNHVEFSVTRAQWGKYRESCRTGWMLEHCQLAEPTDQHIWRDTDDPRMLAMCCRLLAKNTTEGQYPPLLQMREALEAGKKLYAQPQIPITEYKFDRMLKPIVWRHSYLLYRRLVIELAIRVGELETAAEVLGLGLRLDGFNSADGAALEHYLLIPGIHDVLPLLAKGGKDSNPFFIKEEDAEAMVKELISTLEIRATKGRQWSLAADKVGWKELLERLAKGAWKVNKKEYRANRIKCVEHILNPPATEEEILAAENEVGELPADLKEMIKVANG